MPYILGRALASDAVSNFVGFQPPNLAFRHRPIITEVALNVIFGVRQAPLLSFVVIHRIVHFCIVMLHSSSIDCVAVDSGVPPRYRLSNILTSMGVDWMRGDFVVCYFKATCSSWATVTGSVMTQQSAPR